MPFLEVFAFDPAYGRREELGKALTGALADAYGISKDIISIYFFRIDDQDYAHAGSIAPPAGDRRMFIKLHAFRRESGKRRAAARQITDAAVAKSGIDPKNVIVYFLDREPDEVAHAGLLASEPPAKN